ncbi:2974_t:CDS:1, partial [Entrophospora sp. SA101]
MSAKFNQAYSELIRKLPPSLVYETWKRLIFRKRDPIPEEEASAVNPLIEAFLRHEVNRYQKKIKFQWRNWLLLKDLSNNYNMDKETNTISNCICNHEEEINRKVKKEVEILYRQILNHNQETFEKFMKKLDK